jgi:hypothetical protein
LLLQRKQAILTRRLWFQLDERRGSEHRGSKPATRIRARFDRIDQAEAFAATFGDSRTMIYAVTAEGRSAHIKNA